MYKHEDSESPPMIFKETTKLLESMEINEEQIFKMKCLLEHKQSYYEQLQQHDNELHKSIAGKRASLAIVNNRASFINTKNSFCRGKGKKICDSVNAACQYVEEADSALVECGEKSSEMSKQLGQSNAQYEKKIEDLTKLLNELTTKRKKKLEALGLKENELRQENIDLNNLIKMYENDDDIAVDDSDTSDLEELEEELKNLQSKLSILDEEYGSVSEQMKSCQLASEHFEKTCQESMIEELQYKTLEVNKEVSELVETVKTQNDREHETITKYQTLEDYEKKLNEELTQTSKFWEDLERNQYGGFSKLEQEMAKIRADISERNEKYGAAKEEKSKYLEVLENKKSEIGALNPMVQSLASELKEVETFLENLKSYDDLSEQYDTMVGNMTDLHNEKALLESTVIEKEGKIQNITDQLNKNKEKGDLEIISLETTYLMKINELERQQSELETTKNKAEQDAKSSESRIKELEDAINAQKEKTEVLVRNNQDLDKIIEEAQKNLKINTTKKEEIIKKLAGYSAPKPIYVKKKENQDFARPKIPGPAKAKRNFDSDSSMDGEEESLSECLKKKKNRRANRK